MKKDSLTDNITELNDIVKNYLEARVDLWKVMFLEKLSKIGTYFFSAISILLIALFFLLCLTLAFSFWYGNTYGNLSEGFLISAGFFVLLAFILFFLRKQLFSNNIIKNIASIVFSEEDKK